MSSLLYWNIFKVKEMVVIAAYLNSTELENLVTSEWE